MTLSIESILIIGSFLLFISIIATRISHLGIPTLVIFLAIGIIAGNEGIGGIQFENIQAAKVLGMITLTLILFSGGLDTEFKHIRAIAWNGILLSTVGVFITAFSIGYFVHMITEFTLSEGLLVGAIISSTDAAAVFSILRSRNIYLSHNLAPTLELESGSNDVMALFLMTLCIDHLTLNSEMHIHNIILLFLKEMCIGSVFGVLAGYGMVFIMNRAKLIYDSLYPGLILSMILFNYSITNYMHGSGLLSVYVSALVMSSKNFIHKRSIIHFYDGMTWLMQVVMFLVLGLLVSPSKLIPIAGIGVLISLVLMFVARPLGVFVSLAPLRNVDFRQKMFISWVGLRGAVPIVFATYPLLAGLHHANTIFHIVFFIVVLSVLLQGTTLGWLSLRLKLQQDKNAPDYKLQAPYLAEGIKSVLREFYIPGTSATIGQKIIDINIPEGVLILLIRREKQYIVPKGDTVINEGDRLTIMSDEYESIKKTKAIFGVIGGTYTPQAAVDLDVLNKCT